MRDSLKALAARCDGTPAILCTLFVCFAAGCTYRVSRYEVGTPIDPAGYRKIVVGESGLKEVLASLGPPDGIRHTLDAEILEYRSAQHQATDLNFVLPAAALQPAVWIGMIQGVFQYFVPLHEPEEFGTRIWVLGLAEFLFGQLVSLNPVDTGSDDLLVLEGRNIRFDSIRIVLDRHEKKVRAKGFDPASAPPSLRALWQQTFLQADENDAGGGHNEADGKHVPR